MKRATMRSGAFMTQTSQGMVRGCRACKAPLAADMSCTRCGPKYVVTKPWAMHSKGYERLLGIPLADMTCKACGYVEHAPTCTKLRAEQAELERIRADMQRQLAQQDAQAHSWIEVAKGAYARHIDTSTIAQLGNAYGVTTSTTTYAPSYTTSIPLNLQTGVNGTSGYASTDTRNAYALGAVASQPVPHTSNNFAAYVAQRANGGASK